MIYHLTLQTMGLAVGILLVLTHIPGLVHAEGVIRLARAFPRSRAAATVLLTLAAVWSFLLVRHIDLGEFSRLRNVMLLGIVVGSVLSWLYVEEFLAVRALGILLLLAAEPVLESAVLRVEPSRILLVVLAYAWVVAGLFLVGMPYLLRDALNGLSSNLMLWRGACLAGLLYGGVLALLAIFFW
jgi:hypothetical protein